MTTPGLLDDLKRDEGFRAEAYADTGGVWTIGYGHTPATPGERWTTAEAVSQLARDAAAAEAGLDRELPWWRTLDPARQDALANMAFNLGLGRLTDFRRMLAALRAGDFAQAAAEALLSDWARAPPQGVGQRADRIAALLRTGERA